MAFPETALDLRIEFAFGANGNGDLESFTWTDVTDDFDLAQQIQISRGRADETQHVQPTSVSFELDNASGDYTPTDPRSAHWPHVKRGVPCRISLVVASEPHVRFTGMVDSWAPDWPFGDRQASTGVTEARVVVTANGVLHRLSQGAGAKTLDSALTRFLTAKAAEPNTSLIAWWPLEDEGPSTFTRRVIGARAGSSFALSPMSGVQPMHLGGEVNFAADDSNPAAAPVISINSGDPYGWNARVPRRTSSRYQVNLLCHIDGVPGFTHSVLAYVETTGRASVWVFVDSAGFKFRARDRNTGATIVSSDLQMPDETGGQTHNVWFVLSIRLTQSGSNVAWRMQIDPLLANDDSYFLFGTYSGALGRVAAVHNFTRVAGSDIRSVSYGHLFVSTNFTTGRTFLRGAVDAWHNETAAHRIHRLCDEEGLPVEIIGDPTAGDPITSSFRGDPQASERMGFQRPEKLLDLLQECAEADGGLLYESRDQLALEYRTRQTMVNQTPALELDAKPPGDIDNPFAPTLDDSELVTMATVKRPDGSSRIYDSGAEPKHHKEFNRNHSWDRDLRRYAAWLVGLSSWPEMRYPSLSIDLAKAPHVLSDWIATDLGDRLRVDNLPSQHPKPELNQLMQGYSEGIEAKRYVAQLNISPAGPWTAGVLDETPAAASVEAEGGTESDADGWHYHEFTSDGTLTVTRAGVAQVLVVDGGGGGGAGSQSGGIHNGAGGGGAGGVQVDTEVSLSATTYNVTVGSGGSGASTAGAQGGDGGASSFDTLIVGTGGGGGGAQSNGRAGGSGGGAGADGNLGYAGGSGTAGLGNDGGENFSTRGGAGGGGKGAAGADSPGGSAGAGGNGNSFFDSLYTVGGGGGGGTGGTFTGQGSGGSGGGGNGAVTQSSIAAQNGTANTGGGGGGGSGNGSFLSGGNGGTGIVVVRYQPTDGVDPNLDLARIDTDGTSLADDIDEVDDQFLVSIDKGPAWDASGDYLPAGIDVGGEEMSLTAIGTFSPAEPVHGDAQFSASSSTSHVAPSVTAVGSTSVLTCFWCSRSVVGNYTVPGSMTAFAELDGSESTFRGATQQISSPGATGTRTATFSSSNQWAAASILAHGATGFPVLEDHDQATDTDEITLSVDAEADWWLLAIHAWNTSFFTAPPGPSGGDWAEVARSSVGTTAVPVIRVFTKRVAASGLVEASFAFGDLVTDDNYAWLGAWSGIHAGTQQFTVTRGTNGIQKAHTAGTPVHVADAFRTRL